MYSTTFRRSAAAAVTALATAAPLALAAPAARATTGGEGRASAAVLRADLDVSLLDGGVRVPVNTALNDVRAPATAERTTLSVRVDGVDGGRPVRMLRADVASAKATADARRAEGSVRLVDARVHLPGLPLLSVVEVEQVTAEAVCAAGAVPTAAANVLGPVTVLGKRVTLTAGGRTSVEVPGAGEVTLDLSRRTTTSTTAAATALELKVAVDPLDLDVADVRGTVTLAEASCTRPKTPTAPTTPPASSAPSAPATTPAERPTEGLKPQTGGGAPEKEALAETGGDSRTPYVAAGAAALLAAGAATLVLARRARREQP
ncbi:SCO1860 family LAETG-anchored protein [Streptomyces sp. DH12]|uniref:SCO1860 family LAETG-anchored protein n=1 Tax=Streptomyces sp. DH12 TaxID=2857010 RepID=UPI001E42C720|nr:SCO1860 family LAETG-anchored protein [Streptomyces sp. DH12]